jgi:hypothetical protein
LLHAGGGPGSAATPNEVDAIHCTDSSQFTGDTCDISQAGHAVLISGGTATIQNCYFHDFYSTSGSHYDGIWVGATSTANPSVLIQNNCAGPFYKQRPTSGMPNFAVFSNVPFAAGELAVAYPAMVAISTSRRLAAMA